MNERKNVLKVEKFSLRAARVNAHLNQTDAAHKLGITHITLSNYEKGKSLPRIDVALRMARLYNLPIDALDFSCGAEFR